MAVGNKKIMLKINSEYVLDECRAWCKANKKTIKSLSEELGHTGPYINGQCRAGAFPVAELKVLCDIIKIKMDDCLLTTHVKELTVKDLIETLQKYDGDLPVVFGAKIADFDDWLDIDKIHRTRQFCDMHDKGAMRTILAIELKE